MPTDGERERYRKQRLRARSAKPEDWANLGRFAAGETVTFGEKRRLIERGLIDWTGVTWVVSPAGLRRKMVREAVASRT